MENRKIKKLFCFHKWIDLQIEFMGDDVIVAVRTDKNEGTFYAMDGSEHAVKAFKRETLSGGDYAFFNVGVINSFRGGFLEI